MRVTIYQPQYFPRLHYFNRILNADTFVVLDSAQYTKSLVHFDTEQKRTLGKNPARIYLDLIIKYSQGLATQLMVYNLYNSLLPQFSEPYEAEFAALITDDFIESQRQHHKMARIKTFDSFDVRERILTAKSDDASKKQTGAIARTKKRPLFVHRFLGKLVCPVYERNASLSRIHG